MWQSSQAIFGFSSQNTSTEVSNPNLLDIAGQSLPTSSEGPWYTRKFPGDATARPRTRFVGYAKSTSLDFQSLAGDDSGYVGTWAYPSVGGVIYGEMTAVQLKQLGLSNIEEADRSQKPEEEDTLSLALLQQGAQWWSNWGFFLQHRDKMRGGTPYEFHFPPYIYVARTASGEGAWVMKCQRDVRQRRYLSEDNREPALPLTPEGLRQRRALALTADEACQVMEISGATFYTSFEDCEDLPKSIDEGVARGKKYEELLRRMEHPGYELMWKRDGKTDWPPIQRC